MTLTLADAIRGSGARVARVKNGSVTMGQLSSSDLSRPITRVSIDSRLSSDDSLFIALPGESTHGRNYVKAAFLAGARYVLVDDEVALDSLARELEAEAQGQEFYVLLVDDALGGLQKFSTDWRQRHPITVIGVTGSVGKTTAKEVIASVLSHVLAPACVLKNEANLNTEIGLPLTLLGLASHHRVAILEMAMYQPGDIALLARLAQPLIGVVTNISPVHLERLNSIERIARAKSELIAALPPSGLSVLNADDEWTRAMGKASGVARTVFVGLTDGADYQAIDVESRGLGGMRFTVQHGSARVKVSTPLRGKHMIHSQLAAFAVGEELGVDLADVAHAISSLDPDIRHKLVRRGGMTIIDDTYNASPLSMHAALDLLKEETGARRVAVLGDMLELGTFQETAHREIGEHAASAADWLIVRGNRAAWIAEGAVSAGFDSSRVERAGTNQEAAELVKKVLSLSPGSEEPSTSRMRVPLGPRAHDSLPSCIVLVKGSRGMRMEEVVEALRA